MFGIDDNEVLDFTVDYSAAFPSTATSFALNGTVDYGSFTAAIAPVVDATNKLITLYIEGIAAGSSSIIVVKAQATQDSTTLIVEIPFILQARDSSGQITPPVAAVGYYATAADWGRPVFMKSGLYYSPGNSMGTASPTLNLLYAIPYLIGKRTTIDLLAVDVTGTTANAIARLGVYEDTGEGYPGDLLVETSALDVDTVGVVSEAVSVELPAGFIWLAYVAQVATTAIRIFSATGVQFPIGVAAPGSAMQIAYTEASVTGALTDPFTSTVTTAGGNMPRVYFRAA